MKKRLIVIFLIFILILYPVSSVIPYKQSLTINNYKIKQVECSNNYLRVLVESKTSSNLYILFKISTKDKKTNNIFTNTLLNKFESDWFLINTNELCNNLKRLEVNGYLTTEDTIIYLNSESSYIFLGKEQSITTTTQEALTQTTTQVQQQITPTKYSYVYLNNKLLERVNLDNNDVNYFHQDHLGSNRVITDNNGNILSKNDYTPFGNELTFSSKSNYKFTGKELDKNNLYYFGARYYSSDIGRFTSVDPSFTPVESSYTYSNNNPITKIDLDGKEADVADSLYNKHPNLLSEIVARDSIALANSDKFGEPVFILGGMLLNQFDIIRKITFGAAVCNLVYTCGIRYKNELEKAYKEVGYGEAYSDPDLDESKKKSANDIALERLLPSLLRDISLVVLTGIGLKFGAKKPILSESKVQKTPSFIRPAGPTVGHLGQVREISTSVGTFRITPRSINNREIPPIVEQLVPDIKAPVIKQKWVPVNPNSYLYTHAIENFRR